MKRCKDCSLVATGAMTFEREMRKLLKKKCVMCGREKLSKEKKGSRVTVALRRKRKFWEYLDGLDDFGFSFRAREGFTRSKEAKLSGKQQTRRFDDDGREAGRATASREPLRLRPIARHALQNLNFDEMNLLSDHATYLPRVPLSNETG